MQNEIELIPYQAEYLPDYISLNLEWIRHYFKVEPHDIEQLEQAQENILDKGGQIYFARCGKEIVGTVALIKDSDHVFELAKMAVRPDQQGKGIGELLGRHVIAEAQRLGAKFLYLVSNQSLTPALTLYAKLGFVEVPVGASLYERANYKAEMHFDR